MSIELRRAALKVIEGRSVSDEELTDSDSRYTTVEVDGEIYKIYMIGTDECFDLDEFYQYGITDDDRILKFYFSLPDDDLDKVDYNQAYRVVDDTGSWVCTDLNEYLEG